MGLPSRSFADVLISKPMESIQTQPDLTLPLTAQLLMRFHNGFPSIEFTDPLILGLSKPYGWSLIGKFTQGYNKFNAKLGRPYVENIPKYLVTMDFK